MLILRRVGARTHAFLDFLPILDCLKLLKTRGCNGKPYPFIPKSKIWTKGQAPTLQDNSLYQLIIQIQPKFLFEQLKVYAQKPLQSGLIAGCFAKLVFDRAPYRKYP